MYNATLFIHSWVRWVVLITGLLACASALGGWLGKKEWKPGDARFGLFFSISIDVQFLVGILLYARLSPITRIAFQNFGAAMHVHVLRFYAVEHIMMGVLALVAVHVTRIASKRAQGVARHRRLAIGFIVTLVLVLATIPWPSLSYARPLFRFALS